MEARYQFRLTKSFDLRGRRGQMRNDLAKLLLQSFLREAIVRSSGMGRDMHFSILSQPALSLPTAALPIFQAAMKDVCFVLFFEKAVMT